MTDYTNYTLEKELEPHQALFSFSGYFNKKPVIWHIHLFNRNRIPENMPPRQYITIRPSTEKGHMHAEIYLKIEKIKAADISKTIIMISQYRRLKTGTHYYGEPSREAVETLHIDTQQR